MRTLSRCGRRSTKDGDNSERLRAGSNSTATIEARDYPEIELEKMVELMKVEWKRNTVVGFPAFSARQ